MAWLLLSVVAVMVVGSVGVEGRTWVVGDSQGWSATMDFSAWVGGKVFAVGDELVFPYSQGAQDVAEVNPADYEACNGKSPLKLWSNGDTLVELTTPGSKYFISTFPGHCPPLRLTIDVVPPSGDPTNVPTRQAGADANTVASISPQQTSAPAPVNNCVNNTSNNWNNNNNNPPSSNGAPLLSSLSFTGLFLLTVYALSP